MVINFRHVGPGGRRLDNVLILIFWEGGHITVHVRPISITLPHCRPMIPPKHAFTWSCVNQLSFIPLGSDVFWAIVAIAGRWRRSTTRAQRRISPHLRRIRLRIFAHGANLYTRRRDAEAGPTVLVSHHLGGLLPRVGCPLSLSLPVTTHVHATPHFHFCMCSKPSTCRKRSSIFICFAKHLLIQDHPRFLKSLKRF